jgi:hypothetical protein
MKSFRYLEAAYLVVAAGVVAFLDAPLWAKVVIMVWIASPLIVNSFLQKKRKRIAAELALHSSDSVQDRVLHDYRERQ